MIEQHIKEGLSNNYVGTLAARNGFIFTRPAFDYGTDFTISRVTFRIENSGRSRPKKNGQDIDIQIKSTTMSSVSFDYAQGVIRYSLEAKTYNDLVERNQPVSPEELRSALPLVLVLFILPANSEQWVEVGEESLILKHSAYWYLPDPRAGFTNNTSTIQIAVPIENRFNINTWDNLFKKFYSK